MCSYIGSQIFSSPTLDQAHSMENYLGCFFMGTSVKSTITQHCKWTLQKADFDMAIGHYSDGDRYIMLFRGCPDTRIGIRYRP